MALNNGILLASELIRDESNDDTPRWRLIREREANGVFVEVAELLPAPAAFVVKGSFETRNITPGSHEVAFGIKIMREKTSDEPNMMVKLRVPTLQNQLPIEHVVDLAPLQNNQWIEIILPIPDNAETRQMFQTSGNISFSMAKTDPNFWPGRFLLSGVQLRPAHTRG